MTHTYAVLDVPRPIYATVRALLAAAEYQHAFHAKADGEVIDMHGIALRANQTGPRGQGDGDPGQANHAPLIEQLESWADSLAFVEMGLADGRLLIRLRNAVQEMRQVAGDLAREDEARG